MKIDNLSYLNSLNSNKILKQFNENLEVLNELTNKIMSSILEQIAKNVEMFEELNESAKELHELSRYSETPLLIVIMGEFKTGKSTFINALLGQECLKCDVNPTTAVVTELKYGEDKKLFANFKDGTRKEYSVEDLNLLSSEGDSSLEKTRANIKYLEINIPNPILKNITLVDTPGLNSDKPLHTIATKEFISQADSVIWIFSCEKACSRTELEIIKNLEDELKPIAVVNKIDEIDPEEDDIDDVLDELRRKLESYTTQVVGVSAFQAMEAQKNNDNNALKESRWEEFNELFKNELIDKSELKKCKCILIKLEDCINKLNTLVLHNLCEFKKSFNRIINISSTIEQLTEKKAELNELSAYSKLNRNEINTINVRLSESKNAYIKEKAKIEKLKWMPKAIKIINENVIPQFNLMFVYINNKLKIGENNILVNLSEVKYKINELITEISISLNKDTITKNSCENFKEDKKILENNNVWLCYSNGSDKHKLNLVKSDGTKTIQFNDIAKDIKIEDEYIYYVNVSDENNLYRMNIYSIERMKICNDKVEKILGIVNEWIYYLNAEDCMNLYRINSISGVRKKVCNDYILEAKIVGEYIYFINKSDKDKLYKITIEGQNKTKIFDDKIESIVDIFEDSIYFINGFWNRLYRLGKGESEGTKLIDSKISPVDCILYDRWFYYRNNSDGGKLYKTKVDGSETIKLNNDNSNGIYIYDGFLYYQNDSDNGNLYKIRNDGMERTMLCQDKPWIIRIKDNEIYYKNEIEGYSIFKIKTDGTERTKINNHFSQNVIITEII